MLNLSGVSVTNWQTSQHLKKAFNDYHQRAEWECQTLCKGMQATIYTHANRVATSQACAGALAYQRRPPPHALPMTPPAHTIHSCYMSGRVSTPFEGQTSSQSLTSVYVCWLPQTLCTETPTRSARTMRDSADQNPPHSTLLPGDERERSLYS